MVATSKRRRNGCFRRIVLFGRLGAARRLVGIDCKHFLITGKPEVIPYGAPLWGTTPLSKPERTSRARLNGRAPSQSIQSLGNPRPSVIRIGPARTPVS